MKCGVWNQMKIWSSHLLDNLSNCLMNLKNSGDSTGFEPMSSAMPVQCSNQLSCEVTQLRVGQFVGLSIFFAKLVDTFLELFWDAAAWLFHFSWFVFFPLTKQLMASPLPFLFIDVINNWPVLSQNPFPFLSALLFASESPYCFEVISNFFLAEVFPCFPVKGMSYERFGSNPVESPEFFRFMRQLLKLSSKCEDHIFI